MKTEEIINRLLLLSSCALTVGGLILLIVSICSVTSEHYALFTAMAALLLANLFNIIRIQYNKNQKRDKTA